MERVQKLEEEKNALLDYIEESEASKHESQIQNEMSTEGSKMSPNEMNIRLAEMSQMIRHLEAEKAHLYQMTEDLKYQEGMSRQRICELQAQLNQQPPSNRTLGSQREETFGNLPLVMQGDQVDQANTAHGTLKLQQTQGNSTIDYMVLDLNNIKQELADTQNQFESTREVLEVERQEKQQIQNQLDLASERLNHMEKVWAEKNLEAFSTEGTKKYGMNNTQSSCANFEQKTFESNHLATLDEENNKLKAEVANLSNQLQQQIEENRVLKQTLDETQLELESLVNDHESLTRDYQQLESNLKAIHEQPGKLREEAQSIRDMLDERCNEVATLQQEIKTMSDSANVQNDTIKQLRAQNIKLEGDIAGLKMDQENMNSIQESHLEAANEDLRKEIVEIREQLAEKAESLSRLERDVKTKQSIIEEVNEQKSGLLKRIENLNHEVRSLQSEKEKKDHKLKTSMKMNEDLHLEIEGLKRSIQQMRQEKDHTVDLRKEDGVALDAAKNRVEKQTKVINKICRDVGKVQELVHTLSKEFQIPNKTNALTTDDGHSRGGTNKQLDEQLREANSFLKQVGEWLVQFAKMYKQAMRKQESLMSELEMADKKLVGLDNRCRTLALDDQEVKEKEMSLAAEIQSLKQQLNEVSSQQKDGYDREERIHKQNQTIRSQLDACKIQKDKLALQLKTLLSEKESLKERNEQRDEDLAEQDEKSKSLEIQISTLVEQKHQILDLMVRVKAAFPSESLKEVFGQIIDSVHEGFRLEEEYARTENDLNSKEGQLRQYAKREVDGLLSTKVINIRKDVDKGRLSLRQLEKQKEELKIQQDQLEVDLKNTETMERRRNDVALETEQTLQKTKRQLQELQQEHEFVVANRADIEVALRAAQQEKALVERELNGLRHSLKVQAGPNSTLKNIGVYNQNKTGIVTQYIGQSTESMGESQPTAKFTAHPHDKHHSTQQSSYENFQGQSRDMPLQRSRYSSYEPAKRSQDLLSEPENVSPNLQQVHHQPVNSDLPRQMPVASSFSARDDSNSRARAALSHGRVVSSDYNNVNPNLTTAAQSTQEIQRPLLANDRPPLGKPDQNSARLPPTYQSTSASKQRSNAAFSQPLSTSNSKNNIQTSQFGIPPYQYNTGNFPVEETEQKKHTHPQTSHTTSYLYSLRQTGLNSGRSSSVTALQNLGYKPQTSLGDPLQPIPSLHGGELLSSRTMTNTNQERTPASIASPLRNHQSNTQTQAIRRDCQSLGERQSQMQTQNSVASAMVSQNDSSVQHKLSHLRNVFNSIRQNLQDESGVTAQATLQQLHDTHNRNYGHNSSVGTSSGMLNSQNF